MVTAITVRATWLPRFHHLDSEDQCCRLRGPSLFEIAPRCPWTVSSVNYEISIHNRPRPAQQQRLLLQFYNCVGRAYLQVALYVVGASHKPAAVNLDSLAFVSYEFVCCCYGVQFVFKFNFCLLHCGTALKSLEMQTSKISLLDTSACILIDTDSNSVQILVGVCVDICLPHEFVGTGWKDFVRDNFIRPGLRSTTRFLK